MNRILEKLYYIVIFLSASVIWIWMTFVIFKYWIHFDFIKNEISLWEMVNALVAICLGFSIPWSIWKALESKKSAKEILISRCINLQDKLILLLDYVKEAAMSGVTISPSDLIHHQKMILLQVRHISNITNWIKDNHEINFPNEENKITDSFINFRSFTNTMRTSSFEMDKDFYYLLFDKYTKFDKEIEWIKFKINNS